MKHNRPVSETIQEASLFLFFLPLFLFLFLFLYLLQQQLDLHLHFISKEKIVLVNMMMIN
jgi:hypothetical protein